MTIHVPHFRLIRLLALAFLSAALLTGCPNDEPQPDWVNRADLFDQYVVSALTEGAASSVIPETADADDIERRIRGYELLLDNALSRGWGAEGETPASRLRLAGIDLGVSLRRLFDNQSLTTEIPSLQSREGCATDLTLGRHLARYTRALAAGDDAERLLVLAEWQNGLNCLSARQTAALAEVLGASLMALEARLTDNGMPAAELDRIVVAFLEPVLLTVDVSKGLLPSAAHFWAKRRVDRLGPIFADEVSPVHLYDFVSGNLAEIEAVADLGAHLDELLDRVNIGLGTCGFIEMLGVGLDTGRFDCGRGLACGSNLFDPSNPFDPNFEFPSGSPRDLAELLNRPELADLSLISTDPAGSSALDVPMSDLGDNCGGVGSADRSGDPSMGAGMGFLGCMFRAAVANAREGDVAYCTLAAMRGAAGQPGNTVVVGGVDPVTGAPVIRGIFSNDECATDPLAENDNDDPSPLHSPEAFKQALRNAGLLMGMAGLVAGDTILQSGYLTELGTGIIDRWGTGTGGATSHTTADPGTVNRVKEWLNDDLQKGWPWESGEKSTVKQRVAESLDKLQEGEITEEGVLGTYNHSTGVITVDADKHIDFTNVVLTVLDEVAHSVERAIREGTGMTRFQPSERQLHLSNYAALCQVLSSDCSWILDVRNAQAKENEGNEGEDSENPSDPEEQLPAGPHGPDGDDIDSCSALGKTLRAVMECHGFDEVAPGVTGPGDPPEPMGSERFRDTLLGLLPDNGGDVDPSEEQWIASLGSGLFGQCMAEYGLGVVGLDGNDVYVIDPAEEITESRCSQRIDCPPPGTEMQIGEACRCSAPSGVILRDLGVERLCQTSDACFPNPRLLEVEDVREVLEMPVEP